MSGRPSLRRRCAAALEESWICLWGWIPTPVGTLLRLAAWRWCFAACGSARFATGVALLGCRHMRFGNGVRIGRGCFLSAEDGKLELADEAALSPHVHVGADHGLIRIGRQTAIGPGTVIRAANHRFADVSRPIMRQGHDYGYGSATCRRTPLSAACLRAPFPGAAKPRTEIPRTFTGPGGATAPGPFARYYCHAALSGL